jgi:hypothetical protein
VLVQGYRGARAGNVNGFTAPQRAETLRTGELAVELMPISKDASKDPGAVIIFAQLYTSVEETDKALCLIQELLLVPCLLSVALLRLDPAWDPLPDNPRFQALLQKYDTN